MAENSELKIKCVGWRRASKKSKADRVRNLHVADPPVTLDSRKTPTLSFHLDTLFSPPAMTVFPLAFVVLSLSLLVCAADLYKVLQG